jgi:hypothetical protein
MKALYKNHRLGAILALVGILVGFLAMIFIAQIYMPVVEGKILEGRPDEAITVRITYALMGWVGMTGGALWAVSLYGFLKKEDWSWSLGVAAATMQILSGFFPMIPAGSIGMFSPTLFVILLAFGLWFGMLWIGGVKGTIIALAFVTGMAYVMTYIDGVGAISRYQTVEIPFTVGMYAMGQLVCWLAAAAWVVFIVSLVSGKPRTFQVGILAASLAIYGGIPVGITDVMRLGRFSMFLPGPILSAIILVIILLPGPNKMIQEWIASSEAERA